MNIFVIPRGNFFFQAKTDFFKKWVYISPMSWCNHFKYIYGKSTVSLTNISGILILLLFTSVIGWFFPYFCDLHHSHLCVHACVLSHFSHVQPCATLWTVAHQAPLSMGFSRQEYWNACLPLGNLPDPGIKPWSILSPAKNLLAGSLPLAPPGQPCYLGDRDRSWQIQPPLPAWQSRFQKH